MNGESGITQQMKKYVEILMAEKMNRINSLKNSAKNFIQNVKFPLMRRLVAAIALTTFSLLQSPITISYSEEALLFEEINTILCQPQYLWDCAQMVRISYRESNYIPTATNYDCYPYHINPDTYQPYICAGILQVMEIHVPDWSRLYDPWYSADISYKLWLGGERWGQ